MTVRLVRASSLRNAFVLYGSSSQHPLTVLLLMQVKVIQTVSSCVKLCGSGLSKCSLFYCHNFNLFGHRLLDNV